VRKEIVEAALWLGFEQPYEPFGRASNQIPQIGRALRQSQHQGMERRTPRKKFLHPDAGGSRSDLGKPTVKTCAGCIDILNTRTRYYATGKGTVE